MCIGVYINIIKCFISLKKKLFWILGRTFFTKARTRSITATEVEEGVGETDEIFFTTGLGKPRKTLVSIIFKPTSSTTYSGFWSTVASGEVGLKGRLNKGFFNFILCQFFLAYLTIFQKWGPPKALQIFQKFGKKEEKSLVQLAS